MSHVIFLATGSHPVNPFGVAFNTDSHLDLIQDSSSWAVRSTNVNGDGIKSCFGGLHWDVSVF